MGSEDWPIVSEFSETTVQKLSEAALSTYRAWDEGWPDIQASIESQGSAIQCRKGCTGCCYTPIHCTVSEGLAILGHMASVLPAERREYFRSRVESSASSLQRLRNDGRCNSNDDFWMNGGMECPFVDAGLCAIYPVRPLDCRARYLTDGMKPDQCRRCSNSAVCGDPQRIKAELLERLTALERKSSLPPVFFQDPLAPLPEVLSRLFERAGRVCSLNFSPKAWTLRRASRGSSFDETWQDDRTDFRVLTFPLSLPDEGDYPPDYTLIQQRFESHPVYDRAISGKTLPDFLTFYKRNPGCAFDWKTRKFIGSERDSSAVPYTVWMSDGPQERLMMWEAAKRARGRVLCGGLGLGIFPQLALGLPRVDSIDVVELDSNVIHMISDAWDLRPWPNRSRCRVISLAIEDYLESTAERYDTVYIDTWDAIYHEYLPHLNYLRKRSERVLKSGGEILLWAYDMMVRQFLNAARLVIERRDHYLAMNRAQMGALSTLYPLVHRLVVWLQNNGRCSTEEFLTQGYLLATRESKNLGVLKLIAQPGARDLLDREYFK